MQVRPASAPADRETGRNTRPGPIHKAELSCLPGQPAGQARRTFTGSGEARRATSASAHNANPGTSERPEKLYFAGSCELYDPKASSLRDE